MKRFAAACCLIALAISVSAGAVAAASREKQILLGDIDGNGKVDIGDATLIQKYCAEFETPYAIGEPIRLEEDEPATQPATQPPEEAETGDDFADVSAFGGENNITLKVWVPDRAYDLTCRQIEAFKAHYPDITFKKITVAAEGESDAAIMVINDPDSAADVFTFPSDQLDKLVVSASLAEVAFPAAVSSMNAECAADAAVCHDALLAYPETSDNTYLLIYDKSVVSDKQAGRLEDVLAACKKAGRKFVMDCGNGFYSCVFAFTGGVIIDGIDENDDTQRFTEYDEDEAVSTLQAFSKLMHDYKGTFVSKDVANIANGLSNKTIAAGIDGTWNAVADEFALGGNLGAAKLPTINVNGSDKQMLPLCGYKYFGVNSHSSFPHAAQVLAYYLAGQTCQKQRAEELGWGPTNKTVQTMPAVTNHTLLSAVSEQSVFAVPQIDISPTFWSSMGNLGAKLYAEKTDPGNTAYFRSLLRQTVSDIIDW